MSDTKIAFMIGCGWVAAGIGALAGALINPTRDPLSYAVAAAFFLLAVGIYMRIDWCAAIALVIFIVLRVHFYEIAVAMQQHAGNGQVIVGFWLSAIVFTQLYVLGVIGTLYWNAHHGTNRYSIVSLVRRARGADHSLT